MANPWDNTSHKLGSSNKGAGNGRIACAIKRDTDPAEVWWRHDTGDGNWGAAPVVVGTVADGSSKTFRTHYDGVYVWVENGVDHIWRSAHYGAAGSWEAY